MPSEKLEKGSMLVLKRFNKMEADIPQNNSTVGLVQAGQQQIHNSASNRTFRDVTRREWMAISILCFINLINYMDRFTVAGILAEIQHYFDIGDDKGGLLQTAFILSYMIFGPIFGYLGDRQTRTHIMAFGILLWSLTTLTGSFMENYWWFLGFRGLVGIGEASYSTIAPTIISDLFVGNIRSQMLALFYFAIPVGSGLGYIIGAETAKLGGAWQWGLRVTPTLGIIAFLLIFTLKEPERGQSEFTGRIEATSWREDVGELVKNRSFIMSTAGFTCVAFVAGALSWWGPKFIAMGLKLQQGNSSESESTAFIFGGITMAAGIVGLSLGCFLSQKLKRRYPKIDPLICAGGLLISAPLLVGATYACTYNTVLTYLLLFLGQVTLNLNWAIVSDILLYVVLPNRRSGAQGFQLLISHALGDAGSPYLIGVLSETFQRLLNNANNSPSEKPWNEFKALQYALFTTCFIEVLGGFFFLTASLFLLQDKAKVQKQLQERLDSGNQESLPGEES